MDRNTRRFHVVLWGATGYTGRLVADALAARRGPPLSWAIAGRDRAKLEAVRSELGAPELPILIGDAHDRASLAAIAETTRVVCTTVGPYALYGSELVAACAAAGTDYCDLTGEPHWIRRMIDAHHEEARRTGARIVHTSGFDSIPSDLGVLMVQEHAKARHGRPCARVTAYFGEASGRISGGTIASMFNLVEEARRDRSVLRVVGDPYGLDPTPRQGGPDGSDQRGIGWDASLRSFTAPFVMATINTRVVRRSNALFEYGYGRDFEYREVMSTGRGVAGLARAMSMVGVFAGIGLAGALPPLKKLAEQRLPKPGEGPTPEQRARGHFIVRLIGQIPGVRARVFGKVADRLDPGYGSTARMLSETACGLALDDLPAQGGVLTPATTLGMRLVHRLREAGMTWEVSDLTSDIVPL